jgi:prevent-host-death family protein
MEIVSAVEFQRQIGHYQDQALIEPITVTRNGRERLVMMSVEEYRRLTRRDRRVMTIDDFTQDDLTALRAAEPPSEAANFDHEVTG